jgi:hypothetical protein
MKKTNKNKPELVFEEHPENYNGYKFITLVRYNDQNFLTIVDNIINNHMIVYVLDYCNTHNISEENIISIANQWYESNKDNYPISIEFNKQQISDDMSKIVREFNVEYITRVIGPVPNFDMKGIKRVRRRKKKSIPSNMEVVYY